MNIKLDEIKAAMYYRNIKGLMSCVFDCDNNKHTIEIKGDEKYPLIRAKMSDYKITLTYHKKWKSGEFQIVESTFVREKVYTYKDVINYLCIFIKKDVR